MATTKREAILDAALALFVQKGIDATTTREIAAGAETAEGNIYRHFQSKEDLASQLFASCAQDLHRVLSASIDGLDDPEEQLRVLIRAIFDFAEQEPEGFAYILSAHRAELTRSTGEPLPLELFKRVVRSGVEKGVFRTLDDVMLIGWIVGMTQRAIVLHQAGRIGLSREAVVRHTTDGALRLVGR